MPINENTTRGVLNRYQKVTVVGAGVIGVSWTTLFLAHGLHVVVNDPRPDIEAVVKEFIENSTPTLRALGLPTDDLGRNLHFEADLERAVAGTDLVQENGPERIEFKQEFWASVERYAPSRALLLSSSSAKIATEQARNMEDASRMLVGHPFNPPHLIPLVEIVPGERTDPGAVSEAIAFYQALGKVPRVVKKELSGFVGNRLQRAIFRECCHLVLEGAVTVDELDDIVTSSIGLRWAVNGPFRSFHLGGGAGGFEAFFNQFAPALDMAWKHQPEVSLDQAAQNLIIEQANASFAATPFEQLEADRDEKQLAVIRALAAVQTADAVHRDS